MEKIITRLQIAPSFLKSCYFELLNSDKKWEFSIIIDPEGSCITWNSEVNKNEDCAFIEALGRKVVNEKQTDTRLILDGVSLECSFTENDTTGTHFFRCPQPPSNEFKLSDAFLDLADNLLTDQKIINYFELLGGYFNRPNVRFFEEDPFRLRLFGSFSSYEKDALTHAIQKACTKEDVVIDMSNFEGMGTILYNCFPPLNNLKKIRFLANKAAAFHLDEMGFRDDLIMLVDE